MNHIHVGDLFIKKRGVENSNYTDIILVLKEIKNFNKFVDYECLFINVEKGSVSYIDFSRIFFILSLRTGKIFSANR